MTDTHNQPLSVPPPIVAIGASAGGLEAVSRLFDAMPGKTGLAFIIVQHLEPSHKSMMVELVAKHTKMPVVEAVEGAPLLPDTLTIIPPGRDITLRIGVLHLSTPRARYGARLPFDTLLASLAQGYGARTIAVVLSGTGEDGSHGLAALKAANGHVIAQQPEEAEYDGMARSAVATGHVDQVLALAAMPAALAAIAAQIVHAAPESAKASPPADGIAAIVTYLGTTTAHDFHGYKAGTIGRRIERRMAMLAVPRGDYAAYRALLEKEPVERELLARDMMINVTAFFRDPQVFDRVASEILPDLVKRLPAGRPLRIWVAGCSSGEEAYTLAMLASEALAAAGSAAKLQIFASDVDPEAIAFAREGLYPLASIGCIPPALLSRYFSKDEFGYRVSAHLRAQVVFSVQDVLSDPPFSRMDMVSCRNLLIYLDTAAQARVTSLFHFALREGGILLLGSSETIGKEGGRFDLVAKAERIYRHAVPSRPGEAGFPFSFGENLPRLAVPDSTATPARQTSLADICARAMLDGLAPAAVLVNRAGQCLYLTGSAERYLRLVTGYASTDLLAMAPPALRGKLRLALKQANAEQPQVQGGLTVLETPLGPIAFRFEVRFLGGRDEDLWLVAFLEDKDRGAQAADGDQPTVADTSQAQSRIAELESDLAAAQADLQVALAAQEVAYQEQKAINEEALSVNEEFQSTNEELLTSKEELQSLNEELTALNSQLQETLDRQRLTSDDLQNVLYSTDIGTLFLDKALKIRFFTPAIKTLFSVIPSDIGRPLEDLRALVPDAELLDDAQRVVADEVSIEREVCSRQGAWFVRRIFPYRARDARVEGVVITFADITERKATASALEAAKLEAELANMAKSRFLAAASHDLRQPLQSLTLLKTLLGQVVTGERAQGLLTRLGQTLRSMSDMLDTLLDINQIEAGVVEAHPQVFVIGDMLERLREEFTALAQASGLKLHVVHCSALVHTDPHLLEQMIRNLLGNAIKYTRKGRVLLGCRRRGNMLLVEVLDSGIGIAADLLHTIFEEFHQIGNAPEDGSRGLGLGLSIVQRLGQLLGLTVSVRSIPDKGSVFTITLPCGGEVDLAPEMARPVLVASVASAAQPRRVLVVEDEPDVLDLLEQMLRGQGYEVRGAGDAQLALGEVADGRFRPDVLLTDYNLPNGANGLDLLASLRTQLGGELPAIILSGDISTQTLARIAQADCVQLSKPVNADQLLRAIGKMDAKASVESHRVVPPELASAKLDVPQSGQLVWVIDDDARILSGLCEVLGAAGHRVAAYASGEAFLAAYQPTGESCILADLHLPGISGVDLLGMLRSRGDGVPLILITGSGGIGQAVEAMRMGACDFIEKPVAGEALMASIARALGQAHDMRLADAVHDGAAALVAGLTARQREVMMRVLSGHLSKNIAADLGISQRTVENHRAALMKRMQVRSLPELARLVMMAET
ncbi:chemotaxis protein CheB [Novosphingobium sp. KACC 22771]|uniref:chemotaxis protein CheB n=1 Tax=Novosphingobium sp. KACC 22771 TaxID=3025670 RepID=UPI0023655EA8|nr:chemotaxis protein CheB [Novosphingobium sp. KACC 22771]WDF72500.1 chemotaxis protein CheB [Novosphingobium sp. KACC 22771]